MEELPDCVFDAVIVGAGPAGCAVAAALSGLGKKTLLVDSGVDRKKLFSGELLHPVGVSGLAQLGFLTALERCGALPVKGFAVLEPGEPAMLLSYDTLGAGVTIEHARLVDALQEDVLRRPHVTFWSNARVEGLVSQSDEEVSVRIHREGQRLIARGSMLVIATGRAGALREELGIRERHQKISTMLGLTVSADDLPFAEHGHVFVDGQAPILGYAIGDGLARILVDVPEHVDWKTLADDPSWPRAVPEPLHSAMRSAVKRGKPLFASNDVRLPNTSVRGRVCLVGDAAGCCHPLSVSGMTSAIRDALALREALVASPRSVRSALRSYARARRAPQRTRIALSSALYRCFAESSAEMGLLRRGMRRYWTSSIENQQASLALLAGRDLRMTAMAKEYGSVVTHALVDWSRNAIAERNPVGTVAELGPVARLIGTLMPHARDALVGALSDTAGHLKAQASRMPTRLALPVSLPAALRSQRRARHAAGRGTSAPTN